MNYTMATIKANGYSVELNASGNKRYIVLANESSGAVVISKHYAWKDGEEMFWRVARQVVELMHGWSDWVEMLEAK